ncbi:MAG: flagellar hook-basal body protein FliE [uncultured bacterium]|nr:MAG: flagellar hook-basal body protein FliE [uncultured bacterium]HBH18648.1 flagellar hook-basal body complex protein FliE [Cyanobacteria bacterium UBA9579]
MAGFLNGIQGLGNIGNTNALNGYMNTLKGNMDNFNVNMPRNDTNAPLTGKITKNQLLQDPELAQDMNILTNEKFIDTQGFGINDLSADTAVKTFSNVIGNYMNDVNTKQRAAENDVATFASGGDIDLHNVMISMEKSSLSMNLTLQMRNKILQAYQEMSRIQV